MISKRVFLLGAVAAMAMGLAGCETMIEDIVDKEDEPGYEKYKIAFGAPDSTDKGGSGGSSDKE